MALGCTSTHCLSLPIRNAESQTSCSPSYVHRETYRTLSYIHLSAKLVKQADASPPFEIIPVCMPLSLLELNYFVSYISHVHVYFFQIDNKSYQKESCIPSILPKIPEQGDVHSRSSVSMCGTFNDSYIKTWSSCSSINRGTCVLVSYFCYNTWPQIQRLNTIQIYYLLALKI